jgi:hypothetical protein
MQDDHSDPSDLLRLPVEVQRMIISKLTYTDLIRVQRTSRHFQKLIAAPLLTDALLKLEHDCLASYRIYEHEGLKSHNFENEAKMFKCKMQIITQLMLGLGYSNEGDSLTRSQLRWVPCYYCLRLRRR